MTDRIADERVEVAVPKFGQRFVNDVASDDNPRRIGMYVQTIRRPHERMNPGEWWELTDGRGDFWQVQPERLTPFECPPDCVDPWRRLQSAAAHWGHILSDSLCRDVLAPAVLTALDAHEQADRIVERISTAAAREGERVEGEPWPLFQCPACGACQTYPPAPAGPSRPGCGRHINAVTMHRVGLVPASLLAEARAERDEAREGLAFYAAERNWTPSSPSAIFSNVQFDRGRRARALLTEGSSE